MKTMGRPRRDVVKAGSFVALSAAAGFRATFARAEDTIPFTSGIEPPKSSIPPNACDSHIHIMSTRFPASPHWKGDPVENSDVAAYRQLQKRLGTSRVVVVTPSTYGVDNRATLDALAQFGKAARGIVVVDQDISEAELKSLAARGVTGVRVNFGPPQSWGITTPDRLETMARKVAPLGWLVQINAEADKIVELSDVLGRLPTPLLIDHLARLPASQGVNHPAFAAMQKLLDGGRTWVKLSGAYYNAPSGPPAYAESTVVAKALAKIAPDRLVWGSDWPHRGEKHMPDDARLLNLMGEWVPEAAARTKVLVDNPAKLYGFF